MTASDYMRLTLQSVIENLSRSALTTLGIAIGVAAVVLLTSIGEGINQYVVSQFTQFGTSIIQITPGKVTTLGNSVGAINTVRPLSVSDTIALRQLPDIETVVGFSMGNAQVEGNQRQRRTTVIGTDPDFPRAFSFSIALGQFLPDDDLETPRATSVLGSTLSRELFSKNNPVGQFIRVGGSRFRVVGVMSPKGQMLGFDLDDAVYLPSSRAMDLFAQESLMEIDVLYPDTAAVDSVVEEIRHMLSSRHGTEDFTITTQQQMMDVLGSILGVLTAAVAGLGGISLVVGAIGIVTIMTITVSERTNEIGLFRSLGATRLQVLFLFLGEAIALASLGGLVGLAIGMCGAFILQWALPVLPVQLSFSYVILAECVAIVIGIVAGVMPAYRASTLKPVDALRAE